MNLIAYQRDIIAYQRWFKNRVWLFKWYEMRQLLCECTTQLCQPKFGCLTYRETNTCSHQINIKEK